MAQNDKNNNKKDLIDRYIYDVTRRLPEKMRKDIGEELRGLIEDMAEEQEIEAVLQELGDPAILARKYRGDSGSLISGEYYDAYWFMMKIVLVCTAAGLLISYLLSGFVRVVGNLTEMPTGGERGIIENIFRAVSGEYGFAGYDFGGLIGALLQVFAVITIAFILLEKNRVHIDFKSDRTVTVSQTDPTGKTARKVWNLGELPPLPRKDAVIGKGSMISEIVFSMVIAILYVTAPQWMGVWIVDNTMDGMITTIPIFNMAIWGRVLPLMLTITFLGIIKSIVKLVERCYNIPVMIAAVVTNALSFLLCTVVFKGYPIWNPHFRTMLEQAYQTKFDGAADIIAHWNTAVVSDIVLGAMALAFIIDTATVAYRALRK